MFERGFKDLITYNYFWLDGTKCAFQEGRNKGVEKAIIKEERKYNTEELK